ncbi:hypothetical protein GOV04_01885 [Candidatus Woesearchaeota archaeon]|nr:hypothetical protein [Candidatus Woesearchaeota archaeon]
MAFSDQQLLVVMALFAGVLAAIVYSLRVLVLMDRKIERIEGHMESMVGDLLKKRKK